MTVLGGMQERRSYTMTALLAGAGIEEDSCTVATAHHYGREGCGYTMIELLTGIEGDSCKTALLAGREGQSYTMTALLAGVEGDSCTTAKHAGREECGYTTVRHCSRRGDWSSVMGATLGVMETETQTDCWTKQCSVPGWDCCSACGWEDPLDSRLASQMATCWDRMRASQ